jgi:hypothetical protein
MIDERSRLARWSERIILAITAVAAAALGVFALVSWLWP